MSDYIDLHEHKFGGTYTKDELCLSLSCGITYHFVFSFNFIKAFYNDHVIILTEKMYFFNSTFLLNLSIIVN